MVSKTCTECGEVKPEDEFYFQNKRTGKRQGKCKQCVKKYSKKWAEENKDRLKAWREENRDRTKAWREANKERLRENAKKAYAKKVFRERGVMPGKQGPKPHPYAQSKAIFRRNKHLEKFFLQLPEEVKTACEDMYKLRDKMDKAGGVRYSVDHIVPINGRNVSGLHAPWNLRVVPLSENCSKCSDYTLEDSWDFIYVHYFVEESRSKNPPTDDHKDSGWRWPLGR